ncbi:PIN domain-like protein [Favolaschia claudopus]|uniref:PIN domain-like protein n=1 Tax=Favolaschia claudopus TaxID=2862362 RepID=A0AAW0BHX9_9AGAR
MGIPDYWKIADPAAEVISFKQLAADEGLSGKRRELGLLRVGVDLCLLLTQAQAVFHKPHHAQMGRNPELRAVVWKVAAIHAAGADAVFGADGEDRPSIKRNKRVKAKPHWLIEEAKEVIQFFGFHFHQAPGEAEAELAHLNRIGEIDAVLTDDSDAALFGAIIRRSLDKKDKDQVTIYTSTALASHPSVQLTQGGIFLLAVLRGGNYDTVGLPNCGMGIAHGLARCGFGDSLLAATRTMSVIQLQRFLVGWREDVRAELTTNARGHLKSKHKALAAQLPDDFPRIKALNLYAKPITSWSDGHIPPNTNNWRVKLASLPELALFVKKKFGWKPTDIVDKFRRLTFPGLCIRRLYLPLDLNHQLHQHVVLGRVDDEHPGLSSFLDIIAQREVRPGVVMYQMKIAVNLLTRRVLSRLIAPASAAGSPPVERYFPALVHQFKDKTNNPISSKRRQRQLAQRRGGQHLGFVDLTVEEEDDTYTSNAAGTSTMEVEVIDLT